jgi:hypothetical protein
VAKKMAYVALSVVAVTLVVVDALLALGTLWQGLPCIGTFANLLTVGNMQAWVPLVAVVTLVCVLVAHFHGGRLFGALWVVSLVTLACGVYFAATELFSINDSGGDASLLASYEGKADRSDVTMDTERYEDTISDDSLLDVYRVDDGATDKPVVLYVHGGGWSGGSRKEGEAYLEQFAEDWLCGGLCGVRPVVLRVPWCRDGRAAAHLCRRLDPGQRRRVRRQHGPLLCHR